MIFRPPQFARLLEVHPTLASMLAERHDANLKSTYGQMPKYLNHILFITFSAF
jgi:hypothetical protein